MRFPLMLLLLCNALTGLGAVKDGIPSVYGKEPAAGTEIVSPIDGALMVWVPSGYFTMGMDKDRADKAIKDLGYPGGWEEVWAWEWAPERRVYVSGFFIDKYETTWGMWMKFVAANPVLKMKTPPGPVEKVKGEYALYPASSIWWADAQKYANWARVQLPTEAQWEKAARGVDARLYPWGNELPTPDRGQFVDLKTDTPNTALTALVGSHPKGDAPYGCCDMAGNVMEWTSDWLEPYPNNPNADKMVSYTGHANGCLRGGSFYFHKVAYLCAKRFGYAPEESYYHVGFRAAWTPPTDYFASEAFSEARARVPAFKKDFLRLQSIANPRSPGL